MSERVLIIGAAGGIGQACVGLMAGAGWHVIAADLTEAPGGAESHILDVTNPEACTALAERTGPVDAVIYAAGIVATMPIARTDPAVWRRIMAVNLDGAAHVCAAFTGPMITEGKGGAIILISSAAGVRGEAMASAYSASKAGLIALVQSMAAELTPHQIRVNAVAPGNVDTPMLRAVARDIAKAGGDDEAEVWKSFAHTGAAQRLVQPGEVARVCMALCSPEFSAVTGTTIPVDAGYLL
ncbi:SDR family oxidoreductase [uncultured Marivita sp.]|uniref:SDR family NAD(P)-dependent oxidoreductase n=1 Tax=uncultured Marivita sp. TaxID=888080 RepID=UPI00261FCBE3|nr:SDR family oxidoreductase [uncultured Marivita sp.]